MRRRDLLLLAAGGGDDPEPGLGRLPTLRASALSRWGHRRTTVASSTHSAKISPALGWTDGGKHHGSRPLGRGSAPEQLPGIVKELIASGAAILVTGGDAGQRSPRKRATATIPIVLVGVDDPVALGVVASLGQPPGQRHGPVIVFVRGDRNAVCSYCRSSFPGCAGLRSSSGEIPASSKSSRTSRATTAQMKIEPLMMQATTGTALELAFARLRIERCEAVYVASGPLGPAKRAQLIALRRGIGAARDLFLPCLPRSTAG